MEYQSSNKGQTIDKQKETMETIERIEKFEIFMTYIKRAY